MGHGTAWGGYLFCNQKIRWVQIPYAPLNLIYFYIPSKYYFGVAQWNRAQRYERWCWGFESLRRNCGCRTIGSPADCDSACCGFKPRRSPFSLGRQVVRRVPHKDVIVGSNPTLATFLCIKKGKLSLS